MRTNIAAFGLTIFPFVVTLAQAFQAPGAVSGKLDPGKERLDGAVVVSWVREGPPIQGLPAIGRQVASPAGDFSMSGAETGTYRVCVRAVNQEFVNPCEWGDPVRVDVGRGPGAKQFNVPLRRGVRLQFQFTDSERLLANPENPEAKGVIAADIWQQSGRHVPVGVKYQTATQLVLEAVVPPKTLMRVQLQRRGVRLVQDERADPNSRLLFPDSQPGSVIRSGEIGTPHVFRFAVQPE